MLFNQHDIYIGRSLQLYGEYCEQEADVFRQVVRPGDTVIEVGSNIGALTLPLARFAGPSGRVHAFEPQRVVFQNLCANLALNEIRNTHAYHAAVGDFWGQIDVPAVDFDEPGNHGSIGLGPEAGWRAEFARTETVPLVMLDGILGELDGLRLLKVDVEGMELEVLRGAAELIGRTRPVIYCENDRVPKAEALVVHLRALGYDLFWHAAPLYNPANFTGNLANVFGACVAINMLCVPSEHEADVAFPPVESPFHPAMSA